MQRSNGRSRRVGRGAAFAVALAVVAGGPGRPPAACAAPGDPASSGLHFQPGWNLFAMAVVPDAASTQALMSADGLGRFWEWTGAGYDPAATFSPHCGYWAFCQPDSPTRADGIELWMHGTEPEGVRPAFTPGWNLFGVSRPVPLAPPGALRGTAFRWDAGRQILRVVATSAEGEPGVGYWGYANRGPVANPDTASLFVTAGSLALDVLANDRDPEADPLVITAAGTPTMHGGQVEILDGGHRLRYTPPPDFFGTDHFAYTISDPDGLAAETTVEITVRPNLVERLAISPLTAAVLPGASQGYTVTAEYSDGAVVGNPAGAVLSAEPAGAVSIAGLTVTVAGGADAGPVVITAACGGRTAGAVLDVLAVLRDLTLSPADVTLSPRERQEFTVTAHYSDGTARPNPAGVQFQVSPVESFAVVGQTVTVLTSAPLGAATVSASYAEGGRLSASARTLPRPTAIM